MAPDAKISTVIVNEEPAAVILEVQSRKPTMKDEPSIK